VGGEGFDHLEHTALIGFAFYQARNALEWRWGMASEQVVFYMIHPRRSQEAFFELIEDWAGLVVSDGYGVYQKWVHARQTCLAHLIRTAPGSRRVPTLSWPRVGPGRWWSNVCVRWPKRPRLGANGGHGMLVCASG
jgi:hypothetical protein